jgi:hypothetical protein
MDDLIDSDPIHGPILLGNGVECWKLPAVKCGCICNPGLGGLTCNRGVGWLSVRSRVIVGNGLDVDMLAMPVERGINLLSATEFALSNPSPMTWLDEPACRSALARGLRE